MSVLAAILALTPASPACSPGIGQLLAYSPADGQEDVPTDVVVQLQTGEGYLDLRSEGEIRLSVDGEPVDFRLDGWSWTEDLTRQTGFVTVRPVDGLPADTRVDVQVRGGKGETTAWSFTTGAEALGGAPPSAPSLSLTAMEVHADEVPESTCDTTDWRDLSFRLSPGEADAAGLSWLVVYRSPAVAEDEMGVATPMAVLGPVGSVEERSLRATVNTWYLDGVLPEDECFYALQVGPSGAMSGSSATTCGDEVLPAGDGGAEDGGADDEDEDEDDKGCSTLPGTGAAWLALVAVAGLARRRRP